MIGFRLKSLCATLVLIFMSIVLAQMPTRGQYWEIVKNPSVVILRQKLAKETSVVWQTGSDTLTFAYSGKAKGNVVLCCGIETLAERVASDVYALTVKFQNLEQAVLSWQFQSPDAAIKNLTDMQVWRGKKAVQALPTRVIFRNQLLTENVVSQELAATRPINLYFPPSFNPQLEHVVIYMTDGQSVESFAQILEPFILAKSLPQVVLVGIHNSQRRYDEYVATDSIYFVQHERFVLQEAIPQLERKYALKPKSRWLFGCSNGADWVLRMLARHPTAFAGGVALSPSNATTFAAQSQATALSLYLQAGLYEDKNFKTARAMKSAAEAAGMRVTYHERASGHDSIAWREELPTAIKWLFEKK